MFMPGAPPKSLCVQFRESGRMPYDARQQFVGINEFPMKRATALEWHIHTTPEIVEPSQCNVWYTCFALLCNDGLPWQTIIAQHCETCGPHIIGGASQSSPRSKYFGLEEFQL